MWSVFFVRSKLPDRPRYKEFWLDFIFIQENENFLNLNQVIYILF